MDNDPVNWPPELDALIAAPEHHSLVLENDRVRVLEMVIPAGETTPLHTHCWPSVITIQSWSDFIRRDANGNVTADTRGNPRLAAPGQALWSDPLPPHTLENVGEQAIRLLSVEVK